MTGDDLQKQLNANIRRVTRNGTTYYSLVDLCAVLTGTKDARSYWRDTKRRLKQDGFESWENVPQLKLPSSDGKTYRTDCADVDTCLRIIQSIPSPKAEPVRQWLARVGRERLEEAADPELGMRRAQDRAMNTYRQQGKDEQWIASRLKGIDDRKAFTDALMRHVADITGKHYGIATNEVYRGMWNRDADTLRSEMGLSPRTNLRDQQPGLAVHYQAIVEGVIAHKLGDAQTVTWDQAVLIIRAVARLIGIQARETGALLGVDLATGRTLLP